MCSGVIRVGDPLLVKFLVLPPATGPVFTDAASEHSDWARKTKSRSRGPPLWGTKKKTKKTGNRQKYAGQCQLPPASVLLDGVCPSVWVADQDPRPDPPAARQFPRPDSRRGPAGCVASDEGAVNRALSSNVPEPRALVAIQVQRGQPGP